MTHPIDRQLRDIADNIHVALTTTDEQMRTDALQTAYNRINNLLIEIGE